MRVQTLLLAVLAFAVPTAPRASAFAADKAAAEKKKEKPDKEAKEKEKEAAAKDKEKAAKDKEKEKEKAAKDKEKEKEKAAKDKEKEKEKAAQEKEKAAKEQEKADKAKAEKACSPTCTPTCDCSGKAIKCLPTCTETCDCDGKPIVKALADTKQVADAGAADEAKKRAADEAKKKLDDDAKKKAEDAKKAALEQKAAEAKAAGPIDALRKDRPDRRKQSADRLRRRWGSTLDQEKAQQELKLHARRVAILQRIRATAEAKKDQKTVELVDELLTKEDERDSKVMNSLREGALPPVTP
jgi:hypothetical protein